MKPSISPNKMLEQNKYEFRLKILCTISIYSMVHLRYDSYIISAIVPDIIMFLDVNLVKLTSSVVPRFDISLHFRGNMTRQN